MDLNPGRYVSDIREQVKLYGYSYPPWPVGSTHRPSKHDKQAQIAICSGSEVPIEEQSPFTLGPTSAQPTPQNSKLAWERRSRGKAD